MQWTYEAATKTIRSVPENYWIASMDSWDGAVNHEANSHLIAAAPDLLTALKALMREVEESDNARAKNDGWPNAVKLTYAAIAKATT